MKIKTGCDIVEIKRFQDISQKMLNKIFHKSEQKNSAQSLAGIFAAKESCKKVFNELNWLDIKIKKKRNGKPELVIDKDFISCDLSISHDKAYAMATAVFLIKK